MTKPDAAGTALAGRTAILAGNGRLPEIIASEMAAAGANPFVIAVAPDTGEWILRHDHASIMVTRLSAIISALKAAGARNVVLAGGIKVRPGFSSFRIDWMTLKMLPLLYRSLRKGDDGLLSAAVKWLESHGFTVVGGHQLAPGLLTPPGNLTLLAPADSDDADIVLAIAEARRLGKADIGQAAVARAGQIAAAEDRSGTQAMLERLAQTQTGFGRSGVLAKFAKPQQEVRVDLPAIGPDTVEQAAAAGLAGIAVEAGRSLILDRELALAKANELGIFIIGVSG